MKTKKLVRMAVLIALSYLGSFITPLPGIVSTAALDSAPGFFAALAIGPLEGAIVGMIGHVFTALLHGFPLSLPVHMILAFEMGLICLLFGIIAKKTRMGALVLAILLNGIASPLSLVVMPAFTLPFLMTLVPAILIATVLNVVLATMIQTALERRLK